MKGFILEKNRMHAGIAQKDLRAKKIKRTTSGVTLEKSHMRVNTVQKDLKHTHTRLGIREFTLEKSKLHCGLSSVLNHSATVPPQDNVKTYSSYTLHIRPTYFLFIHFMRNSA